MRIPAISVLLLASVATLAAQLQPATVNFYDTLHYEGTAGVTLTPNTVAPFTTQQLTLPYLVEGVFYTGSPTYDSFLFWVSDKGKVWVQHIVGTKLEPSYALTGAVVPVGGSSAKLVALSGNNLIVVTAKNELWTQKITGSEVSRPPTSDEISRGYDAKEMITISQPASLEAPVRIAGTLGAGLKNFAIRSVGLYPSDRTLVLYGDKQQIAVQDFPDKLSPARLLKAPDAATLKSEGAIKATVMLYADPSGSALFRHVTAKGEFWTDTRSAGEFRAVQDDGNLSDADLALLNAPGTRILWLGPFGGVVLLTKAGELILLKCYYPGPG